MRSRVTGLRRFAADESGLIRTEIRKDTPPSSRHCHPAQQCLVMTDLQAAVLAVVRDDGSGLDPIPRGVYKALLSSRQCDFLVAKFAICTQPDAKTAQRWADMADITLKRLRKFFDNQRGKACKKRKATSAALALVQEESKVDADEQRQQLHADSLLQLLGEPFAADESADLHAGERAASAVPVVAVVVAAAAAASAAACAAAEADAAAAGASAGPSSASGAASTTAADIGCKLEEYLLEHLPWDEHKSSKAMAPPAAVRVTPRLESFHMWLQSRRIDPFSCARLCPSVQRLALLLERHGHGCIVVSFVFAGACVLRTAFEQCRVNPPASAAAWRTLLADQTTTARVSRLSDSLWYHVRRGGVNFSSCLPTKAREDTLTALAIISAIAPHDSTMHELVSPPALSTHTRCAAGGARCSLMLILACVDVCLWPTSGVPPLSICLRVTS